MVSGCFSKSILRLFTHILPDILGLIGLTAASPILISLSLIRSPRTWYANVRTVFFLLRHGLLTLYARAYLALRCGDMRFALAEIDLIAALLLNVRATTSAQDPLFSAIATLYAMKARTLLAEGRLEDAALLVLQACKKLNLENLPGLPDFDAKTAHIIRAAIAAGKLIEGGGIATLLVGPNKTAKESTVQASKHTLAGQPPPLHKLAGASKNDIGRKLEQKPHASVTRPRDRNAKVIPFPPPR